MEDIHEISFRGLAHTEGFDTNGNFVLARAVFDEGRHGFQPVQRFASDAVGTLVSVEPATGERLAGLDGGGQYWLFQTGVAEALVSGTARDSAGTAAAGLLVQPLIMAIIGTGLMVTFVVGLSHSISTGFAGRLRTFALHSLQARQHL